MTAEIIPINNRGWKYYETETLACAKQDAESTIKRGRLLIEAKDELEKDAFSAFVRRHYSKATATRLMIIAQHPIIGNPRGSHVNLSDLPHSWGTLYQMTQLDDDVLAAALKDGTINSKTERKDITQMLARMKDESSDAKPLTATRALIADVGRAHPDGVHFKMLQSALPDVHPQTVKSTLDLLVKDGWFVDSGRREKTSEGGRPAAVYTFTDTPTPLVRKAKGKTTKNKARAPAPAQDRDTYLAKTKPELIEALDGKSAHFIADYVLDIMEACEVSYQFVADKSFKRAKDRGLVTTISFNTPLPDFIPKRRKK